MRRLCGLLVLCLACSAAACGGGQSAGGLSGKSAPEVIALAESAAQNEGSFHFIDQTGSGSQAEILVGDTSDDAGIQELKSPDGPLEVRLVDSIIYVNATAAVLSDAMKLSVATAKAHAGKWISLEQKDAPYETVLKTLAPSAELTPYTPVGDLKLGAVTKLHGHSVIAVYGTASSTVGASAVATLYVSTVAPYVPVGGSLVSSASQKVDSEVVAFTAWGEKVVPQVPTGATPYSSLEGS